MGGLELVSSSSPFPMPLPHFSLWLSQAGPPLSSAILIPQFPPAPSCHQQNLGTLRKLLPHPFLGSLPSAPLPGCGEASVLAKGRLGSLPLPRAGLGSGGRLAPSLALWMIALFFL